MSEIELKPCPFCDGKAEMAISENDRGNVYIIHCSEDSAHCWMDAQYSSGALDELVTKWNTRTDHEAGLVAALEQCREIIIDFGQWLPYTTTNRDVKKNAVAVVDESLKEYRGGR